MRRSDPPTVLVAVPLRLKSLANLRFGHWGPRSRLVREHRQTAALVLAPHVKALRLRAQIATAYETGRRESICTAIALTVGLLRIAPRKLDSDNLAAAFKGVRDGVADVLGIDDGDDRISWLYEQRRANAGDCRVDPLGYGIAIAIWAGRRG